MESLSRLDDGQMCGVPAFVPVDVIVERALRFAIFGQDVDHAKFVEFLAGIDAPAHDHPLGGRRSRAAGQETESAHAREQAKEDFREPEPGAPLGHDQIARQRRLEASAERIALHHGHGDDRQVQTDPVGEALLCHLVGIFGQAGAILPADQTGE